MVRRGLSGRFFAFRCYVLVLFEEPAFYQRVASHLGRYARGPDDLEFGVCLWRDLGVCESAIRMAFNVSLR
jgi:hypothetical protein